MRNRFWMPITSLTSCAAVEFLFANAEQLQLVLARLKKIDSPEWPLRYNGQAYTTFYTVSSLHRLPPFILNLILTPGQRQFYRLAELTPGLLDPVHASCSSMGAQRMARR